MDKVSNSTNSSAQAYASQNSAQVQQTNNHANQANETDSSANTSSAQEPKDSSEIGAFSSNNEAEETDSETYAYSNENNEEIYYNEETEEYCYIDENGEEVPYTEEELAAMGYGFEEENIAEDDYFDPNMIVEDVDLDEINAENENFSVEDANFAGEAGEANGVGKIGDDFLQSEEYYQSLKQLMDDQKSENGCKTLYYRYTLDKDTSYNKEQRKEIAQHKDDYINMRKNGYSDFYEYMAKNSDEFKTKKDAQDYVKARLQEVKDQYEGRAAACMSALVIQEIAAEFGVKLPYAAASTKNHVASDIDPCDRADCSNFVTWALNQAYPDNLFAMNVGQLGQHNHMKITDKGKDWGVISDPITDDYASLPAGSICTNGSKHAMLIMYNNPEKGIIVLAEASSHSNGIQLREVTYDEAMEKGYTGINPESIYDGTSDSYNYGRVKNKNN